MGIQNLLASFLVILASAHLAGASPSAMAPGRDAPFVEGQVVMAGSPADLPPGLEVVKYLPRANLTVVRAARGRERGLVQQYRARGRRVGLNRLARAMFVPNDPHYPLQWHLPAVQSEAAWELADGSGVTVAVLDTGFDPGGSDGPACVLPGRDTVDGDDDPLDGHGHGTHVAGTIAQATGNGTGVAGLAFGACVLPVRVLGDDAVGNFADISEGVYWAVDHGARVINLSLGTDAQFAVGSDPLMDPALDYAEQHGVVVVAAAGNDGHPVNVSYPAIYPSVLAVGATDLVGSLAGYSNRGEGLDLVAPGGDLGADLNGDGYGDGVLQETFVVGAGGQKSWAYWFLQGTSMATPHVAATAALLLADGVAENPFQLRQALHLAALDLGAPGYDPVFGDGLLQAYDALRVCLADFDASGEVGLGDLAALAFDLGRVSCAGGCPGDLDGDGDVDGADTARFAVDSGRVDCP